MKYRPDIDGLRSIAILSVLMFHAGFQGVGGGFVGVDVFFVISGFLITNLIKCEIERTGTLNIKAFYIRRMRRLLPALLATFIITSLVAVMVFSPSQLSRFGGSLASSLISVSNFYFWLEADYFDVSSKMKPLLHTWSLSVEEQFYLIWPLLLFTLIKTGRSWMPPVFLLLSGVASIWLNEVFAQGSIEFITQNFTAISGLIKDGHATIFYLLPFRIFEFCIGALLVWGVKYEVSYQWINDFFLILGLGLVGYSVFEFNDRQLFPSYSALIPTLGASLLIFSGDRSRYSWVLTNITAVGIGRVSYSLYLIHWPLIVYWTYLNGALNNRDQLIVVFLSLTLATISYRYIEQPFRRGGIHNSDRFLKYCTILIVVFIFLGINMKTSDGWNWRINTTSPVVFEENGDPSDFHRKFYGGAGYPLGGVYTDKPADVVLMGDSHARHYLEGIYKLLVQPKNLNLYVSYGPSCIHLPAFTNERYGKGCERELERELSYVRNGNKPLVIISEYWLDQIQEAKLLNLYGEKEKESVLKEDVGRGILKLKELIGDSVLVVIGQVPGAGANLYDVFTRPRLDFIPGVSLKQYLTRPIQSATMEINRYFKLLAEETGAFVFLDPHDILCDDGVCSNLDAQKRLIYSDDGHLSRYGSVEVIRGFMPILDKYVNESTVLKVEP